MRVVTLVPWRGGEANRERNWGWTRPHLEALGYPIFLGDRPGRWARAAACNAAAAEAGAWDVAVIADADTIPESAAISRAVEMAYQMCGAIRPHDRLWNLSRVQSRMVGQRGPKALRINQQRQAKLLGGGLLVVSRRAWEKVGGYDERFIGWGHEDSALHTSLLAEAYWDRIEGQAWHLWHPRDPVDTPERRRNHQLMQAVQAKHGGTIRRESRKRGYDVGAVL